MPILMNTLYKNLLNLACLCLVFLTHYQLKAQSDSEYQRVSDLYYQYAQQDIRAHFFAVAKLGQEHFSEEELKGSFQMETNYHNSGYGLNLAERYYQTFVDNQFRFARKDPFKRQEQRQELDAELKKVMASINAQSTTGLTSRFSVSLENYKMETETYYTYRTLAVNGRCYWYTEFEDPIFPQSSVIIPSEIAQKIYELGKTSIRFKGKANAEVIYDLVFEPSKPKGQKIYARWHSIKLFYANDWSTPFKVIENPNY